jgi:microcompartment protein CcmL/EutN
MEAVGLIETRGMAAAIAAADAMVKEARIALVGYERIGGGLVTVIVRGDVAACKAAVDAGTRAGRDIGEIVSAHVIPSPHANVMALFPLKLQGE